MEKLISEKLMFRAAMLSAEWGNTGFIVRNGNGSLDATVWNNWKWEEPKREVIAYVDANGFKLNEPDYVFEVDPNELLKNL